MGKLADRTALVTGSSRGIGRATAERLAREGALVAVHYAVNADAAEEVVRGIEAEGGRAFAVRSMFGEPGDVDRLFDGLERGLKERTGSAELNILVNNAGIKSVQAPEEVTPEVFDEVIAVNAKAQFFVLQRALGLLPDGGRVINISSGITRFGNPQEVVYGMSKGAVEQLTFHFARHLGPRGITINSVVPGVTDNGTTPIFADPDIVAHIANMSALKRVGQPADVADVVAFLATDDARWITGAVLDASGGSLLG
ncbi:SDR family oxidoreductase [Actinophytocola sp.]|jgi:3-oxoacyl-[acyl-carrier protein] reductase|uniref:SDR family oxidoreductase n=1 Tax=Actinophytocola sp. TaxID=1872138 RepID=UPI002D2CDD84|nr:SDR family oxidoreductase [Actinophytocola sp.]HYQ63130.1 SDR family oxidoreductase [Actinophytocola sp.]